jgi:hypothetical protein
MLLFGAYAAATGLKQLPDFGSLAPKTAMYYATSALVGLALAIIAVMIMRGGVNKPMLTLGTASIAVLAINQIVGLATNSILCFTPS